MLARFHEVPRQSRADGPPLLRQMRPRARRFVVIAHDLVLACASFPIALLLRDGELGFGDPARAAAAAWLPLLLPIFLAVAAAQRMHRGVWRFASTRDLLTIAKVVALALGVFYLLLFLGRGLDGIPRSLPVIQWFVLVVALAGSRLVYAAWAAAGPGRRGLHLLDWEPVLLAGAGADAAMLIQLLRPGFACSGEIVGIVDDRAEYQGRTIAGVPVLGRVADLDAVVTRLAIHGMKPRRIVLARRPDDLGAGRLRELHAAALRQGLLVQEPADLLRLRHEFAPSHPPDRGVTGDVPSRRTAAALKRVLDIVVAGALLLLAAPVMTVVALLLLLTTGRPVLFHQVRPGRDLHPFMLYKFRTLRDGYLPDGRILADAERQTWFGRLLRRSRLDELPQLWNVLKGDMSLIGPRPLLLRDLPDLGGRLHGRFLVRPGITGWAQVNGGHRLSPEDKLALDLWYIRHASPLLDLTILLKTVVTAFYGDRVDQQAIERAWVMAGGMPV